MILIYLIKAQLPMELLDEVDKVLIAVANEECIVRPVTEPWIVTRTISWNFLCIITAPTTNKTTCARCDL